MFNQTPFTQSIFTRSYLRFKLPNGSSAEITAVLDPVSANLEQDYSKSTNAVTYEGFITAISLGSVTELRSGIVGEGEINGQSYRIKLEEISRDSVAIATKTFGENIRVSIIEKISYGS